MNGNNQIIRVVTAQQMREIDRIAIEDYGIPAYLLMNNAGKGVADFIKKRFPFSKHISIFCGTGNNGGDGFCAAYYLANSGFTITLYLAGPKQRVSDTSRLFMNMCESTGLVINEVEEDKTGLITIPDDSLVIDAILGTGFEGAASGIPGKLIKLINAAKNPDNVISVDIPSGMGSDGSYPIGEFINAGYTVTIGLPKISLATYPCKELCGEVSVEEIGFPSPLTTDGKISTVLMNSPLLKTFNIFQEKPDTHKGERGHLLIIGGFSGMEGAALLAASASLKTGCGLLTILTTSESRNIIAGNLPEAMTLSLPDDPSSPEFNNLIMNGKYRSVVIGPGIGRSIYSRKIFNNFINFLSHGSIKKVLIDGDGLFHLAEYIADNSLPDNVEFIITPHFLEASRLINRSVSDIKNNRFENCRFIAGFTKCITVLKGPSTIVSDSNFTYINTSGNSGLATAGSGDVLSGIIGSLLNYDLPALQSAASGVFIHGLAADIFMETNISMTMSSTDIINNIRQALLRGAGINE